MNMSKENGNDGEAVVVGNKGRRSRRGKSVLVDVTQTNRCNKGIGKADGLDPSDEKFVNDSSVEKNKETKIIDDHGIANKDSIIECKEHDKENQKEEVLINKSPAPSSSSTPHKDWLLTSDHRHLTYDEARSANRAKVMMMHLHHTTPTACHDDNGDHGNRSSGGVSRITNMHRRSLGSSMGGRGRGWGSAGKAIGMSLKYTHHDKHTLPMTPNERGVMMSTPTATDIHDNDSHQHDDQDTTTTSHQEEDLTDNFPVELIFEENLDLPHVI